MLFGSGMRAMTRANSNPQAVGQAMGRGIGQAVGAQQRPGLGSRLFGRGWEEKAAALGGLLMGNPNAVSSYHENQRQEALFQRQQEMAAQQALAERQAEREDFMFEHDYRRNNPEPTALERNAAAWISMTPEQRQAYGEYAQAGRPDEDVVVSIPGLGSYIGPRSGLTDALGGAAAPAAPVGQLRPVSAPISTPGNRTNARRITPQELDAIVQQRGPQEAQRMLNAGEIMVEY